MVQWSPDTPSRPSGGGYEYNDSSITGFSLTHIAGPGCGAAGDVPVLPTSGAVNTGATDAFSHATSPRRPALQGRARQRRDHRADRHHPQRHGPLHLPVDHPGQPDLQADRQPERRSSNTQFNVVTNTEVSGSVTVRQVLRRGQHVHGLLRHGLRPAVRQLSGTAVAQARRPRRRARASKNAPRRPTSRAARQPSPATAAAGRAPRQRATSPSTPPRNQVVQAKVGVSYVSIANAVANRTAENPAWNFDATRTAAAERVEHAARQGSQIAGGTADQQTDLLHRAVPLAAAPQRHQRHQRPVLRLRRQDAHRRLRPHRRCTPTTPAGTSTVPRPN